MQMATKDNFGDERLKKDSGAAVRGSRDGADMDRVQQDGSSMSAEQRRRALRQDWVQEILPSPPDLPGFHCCWLSTTNSTDPIYKRVQRGYVPVKASEVPGFGSQYLAQGGEFDGCVACNEMLLFKIDKQVYNDLMTIFHHDMPLEQEASIRERLEAGAADRDSSGRQLGSVEGDFDKFGRSRGTPTFI
jgi:hypothetical protein